MKYSLLCLMATFLAVYGQGLRTPKISYISSDKEVQIGSSAELECSVQYAQNYPVLWVKKGSGITQDLPISTDAALIIRDSRYSLRHDKGSATYILQIKDLQQYDGGLFMCQVIISITNRLSSSVALLVKQPPIIFDNSTRTEVVMKGKPVRLECYATGVPTPKVSWRRENNALLPTGGSVFSGNELLIPSIKKEDRGTYYCIATNGVGKGARRNINVEVEFDPIVTSIESTVKQAQTFDAILECRVEAYPPADISWIFKSESLVTNRKYRISQFTTEDEFADSVLTVMAVSKRDYGNYICRANNRLNVAYTTIVLKEVYSPVCPPACDTPYSLYSSSTRVTTPTLVLASLIAFSFYCNF